MFKPSTFMRALALDMGENPQDYQADSWGQTFDHLKSDLRLWIGNGFLFYGIYRPTTAHFNLADKIAFHRARELWAQASTMSRFQVLQQNGA